MNKSFLLVAALVISTGVHSYEIDGCLSQQSITVKKSSEIILKYHQGAVDDESVSQLMMNHTNSHIYVLAFEADGNLLLSSVQKVDGSSEVLIVVDERLRISSLEGVLSNASDKTTIDILTGPVTLSDLSAETQLSLIVNGIQSNQVALH